MNFFLAFMLQQEGQASPPGGILPAMLFPLVLMGLIFWLMILRPQKKQQKDRENLLGKLKKNDHVVTTGGLFGIVDRVKDNEVILKIDERNDVRIRILRSAIAGIEKVAGAEEKKEEEVKK